MFLGDGALPTLIVSMPTSDAPFTPGTSRRRARNFLSSSSSSSSATSLRSGFFACSSDIFPSLLFDDAKGLTGCVAEKRIADRHDVGVEDRLTFTGDGTVLAPKAISARCFVDKAPCGPHVFVAVLCQARPNGRACAYSASAQQRVLQLS